VWHDEERTGTDRSIRERPAEVDDRAVPGHWEGDLLCGANNTHIATLVERHTRFVMLLKIPSRDTATVVAALAQQVRKLPSELRRSLTWDRGKEMAEHKSFTMATNVKVYFCDPRSPWQRGSNENTNGLLRQYFSRGTDLSHFSQANLNKIALRLNQRPRKTCSASDRALNTPKSEFPRRPCDSWPSADSSGTTVRPKPMRSRPAGARLSWKFSEAELL
jgi:IS30 family transposase